VGHNTKVMLNCTNARGKVSQLFHTLNINVFIMFGIVLFMSMLLTSLNSY